MSGSFYKRGDYAWVQDVRGNFVCIHKGDRAATVFSTEWEPWQVIVHWPNGGASILGGERFSEPTDAMGRAEDLLSGAKKGFLYNCNRGVGDLYFGNSIPRGRST